MARHLPLSADGVRRQPGRRLRADRRRVVDEPHATRIGGLLARALRRARAVGRRVVSLDRRPRLRPGDRARQLRGLLPALPARLAAPLDPSGPDGALGQPALDCPLRRGALRPLPDHARALRRGDGAAHRPLPLDLPIRLRVLAALCGEPLPRCSRWARSRSRGTGGRGPERESAPWRCSRGPSASRSCRRWPGGPTAGTGCGCGRTCRCSCCRSPSSCSSRIWLEDGRRSANVHAQERGWERGIGVLPYVFGYTLWHDVIEGGHLRFLVHLASPPLVRALLQGVADADAGRIPGLRGRS